MFKKRIALVVLVFFIVFTAGSAAFVFGSSKEKAAEAPEEVSEPEAVEEKGPSGELILFHWWTAAGEKEAMHKSFELFEQRYPDVDIVENPVAGGGGANIRSVLASKLAAGMPPDGFNILEGAKIKVYIDSDFLEPIDDIWYASGMEDKYLLDKKMLNINGHYWAMPFHANRANYIWYDKQLFEELGLTMPKDADDLLDVCKTIAAKKPDIAPISLGSKYKWTTIYTFDTVLLSMLGSEFYKDFYTGKVDIESNADLRSVVEKFKKLVPYIYEYHSTKTWDEAADLVFNHKAAMYIMGDWAYGRFLSMGWKYDVELGGWPFPDEIWFGHPDCYTLCKGAPSPDLIGLFLENESVPETQLQLSLLKGSTACVKGVDPSDYPDRLRQHNMAQLLDPTVPKMGNAFAGLSTPAFVNDFMEILQEFLYDVDVDLMLKRTADSMAKNNVKEEMAWYWE